MDTEFKTRTELGFVYRLFVIHEEPYGDLPKCIMCQHFQKYSSAEIIAETWFLKGHAVMIMQYEQRSGDPEPQWLYATIGKIADKELLVVSAIRNKQYPIIEVAL